MTFAYETPLGNGQGGGGQIIKGSVTTSDSAGQTQFLTMPFSVAPEGTYGFAMNLVAYDLTDGASVYLVDETAVRTTNGDSFFVGNSSTFFTEDPELSDAVVNFIVNETANTFQIQVEGISTKTINWSCVISYFYQGT